MSGLTITTVAVIAGLAVYMACIWRLAQRAPLTEAVKPQAADTPHQAETRDFLLRGSEGVPFSDRVALCAQLDRIIALDEVEPDRVVPL